MFSTLLLAFLAINVVLASPLALQAREDTRSRVAYVLGNKPEGNVVLSLAIDSDDGRLSSPVQTSTGGKGLIGLTNGQSNLMDSLFSQGAVAVSQDYLFTVNPGSHTLSFFIINHKDPLHPKLVGEPCDTLGEFPMSVTYSSHLKTACVLNGGAIGGVACFSVDHAAGLKPLGPLHPIPNGLHQTTPPQGPPNTAADIVFNPSSTALFATIKGDPTTNPVTNGYTYIWPIVNGDIATEPKAFQAPDIILDFSLNFLGSDSSALLTDPAFGASIISISPSFDITEIAHVPIPFQGADCWGTYAPRFDSAYVIDAGHPNITVVDPASGKVKGVIEYDASALGVFDTAIDRTYMYVLAGSDSIVVLDLEGSHEGVVSKQVQQYDLSELGARPQWQGMAIYPS